MTAFSDLRAALVTQLAGMSCPVHPSWPVTLSAPCAFITPPLSGEYVRRGPTFREHTITLDLVILVAHQDAATALNELEALLEYALIHTQEGWSLEGVEPPAPTTVTEGGAEYLATVVHLSTPVSMY